MSNAFTPPGATNASQQQANQGLAGNDSTRLLQSLFPSLQQEANYSGSLEPQREQDINRAIMLNSPGNAQARTNLYNTQVQANAAQAAKTAALQDQAAGIAPSYQAGQNTAIQNAANQAENQYAQNQLSPQQALANAQSSLGAISNGMAMPELPALSGLSGLIYGQPKVQVGQGLGGFLGGLAGDYLGGDIGGLGGGSGGGGNGLSPAVAGNSDPNIVPSFGFGEGIGPSGAGYAPTYDRGKNPASGLTASSFGYGGF